MRKGVLYAVAAYLIWGFFPMYWPLLEPAGALEILAHRMFWSAVVMALAITVIRYWPRVKALTGRQWGLIALAAIAITINWGVYIYAVNNGHVIEGSLGYFINPLVAVALAVIVLRERLSPLQWAALAVAAIGVVLTALGANGFPYLALILAVSFGFYALIKRVIRVPSAISLLGESTIVAGPALAFLIYLQADGRAHVIEAGPLAIALAIGAGLVTAVPLLFFGAAARLIPLSVLGFLQYMNPLTQFLLGVFWAHEAMPPERWAGFGVIWLALALLSADLMRRSRAVRSKREGGWDGTVQSAQ